MRQMKRPTRYFGMTVAQVSILAVLACLACGLTGAALYFVLNSLTPPVSVTPTAYTKFDTPASPASVTPTLTATATRIPSPTPTKYEDAIPEGWNQYREQSRYEIWFPPEYTPVDQRGKLQELIQVYEDSGYSEIAQSRTATLEEDVTHYVLWMADTVISPLRYQTNVSIATYPLEKKDLSAYVDAQIQQLPPSIRVIERRPHNIGNDQAERLWLENSLSNTTLGMVMYVIRANDDVWVITCYTHFNEFYIRAPVFDQIVNTFRTLNP
ncbi:MAG: hypothetical protein Fur0043_15060 [Anaerolineales bacterium]